MSNTNSPLNLAIGAMLVGGLALGASTMAQAFQITDMDSGYQLVSDEEDKSKEGSCGEGKCGGAKAEDDKSAEGSCGGDKSKEGSCGEGKCGGEAKKEEGEGSCGGNAV
ncbi:MAG: hypothetical protein IPO08_17620 [Xanthomonadales bacterium]|nr:hypothetical protein [Xanthomonadales bacterium]